MLEDIQNFIDDLSKTYTFSYRDIPENDLGTSKEYEIETDKFIIAIVLHSKGYFEVVAVYKQPYQMKINSIIEIEDSIKIKEILNKITDFLK
jgi:hypothetical protein